MPTISETLDVLTMIVVFTVEPDEQDALVEYLRGVAADHSRHEGFVSCTIHRSLDGVRVAEYIQWRSQEHLQAMLATPAGRAHVENASLISDAHPYEVVVAQAPTP